MPAFLSPLRLKAEITIEFDADNYMAAAEFQNDLEKRIALIRGDFPHATIDIRERRPKADRGVRPRRARIKTGRVNRYE